MEDQTKARRLSELFPPCSIIYSTLLASANCSMPLEQLYEMVSTFPEPAQCRQIFLSKADCKRFGFQSEKFSSRLSSFVEFSLTNLKSVICSSSLFRMEQNIVSIQSPPEIDFDTTLFVLNQIFSENRQREQKYISIFHQRSLEIQQQPSPPFADARFFLTFSHTPEPSFALLSLFCYKHSDSITLSELFELRSTIEATVGPSSVPMTSLIPNLMQTIFASHFVHMVDSTAVVTAPVIYKVNGKDTFVPFVDDVCFSYTAHPSTPLRPQSAQHKPKKKLEFATEDFDETKNSILRAAEKFKHYNIEKREFSFHLRELLEYIAAEYALSQHDFFLDPEKYPKIQEVILAWLSGVADPIAGGGYPKEKESSEEICNPMFDEISRIWCERNPSFTRLFAWFDSGKPPSVDDILLSFHELKS